MSMLIDSAQLTNDAYCPFRSTQRTLAKVSCWLISRESGLLGCDFANAFGNACRPCVNQLLGFEFLNPTINFSVNTAIGSSETAISTMGTGAGRATGGPGFNVLFNHHLTTHPVTKKMLDWLAPFADDSEFLVKLKAEIIRAIIQSFEQAESLGLKVHRTGSKGPTLLVHEDGQEEAKKMLVDGDIEDVNVVSEVKFLGIDIHICTKNNVMVGKLPVKVIRKLNYLVIELGRNYKLSQLTCNSTIKMNKIFRSVSNSVASLIESRFQYAICFLDRGSIYRIMQIHRRALCSLAGKSARFFGFKNFDEKLLSDTAAVSDLYECINEISSSTYTRLCAVLGRPTLLQIALRAVNVIHDQANLHVFEQKYSAGSERTRKKPPLFVSKIKNFTTRCEYEELTNTKPKLNDYHQQFLKMETYQARKNFIKAATDTLLLEHLSSKGWDSEIKGCRVLGCSGASETLEHVFHEHLDEENMNADDIWNLRKALKTERKGGRIRLNLTSSSVKRVADCFRNVKEPFLQARKKAKND